MSPFVVTEEELEPGRLVQLENSPAFVASKVVYGVSLRPMWMAASGGSTVTGTKIGTAVYWQVGQVW